MSTADMPRLALRRRGVAPVSCVEWSKPDNAVQFVLVFNNKLAAVFTKRQLDDIQSYILGSNLTRRIYYSDYERFRFTAT